jgi:Rrf2 family iron-sulfur cluster assembly transcriptional regulator
MNMTLSKRGDYVLRSALSLARCWEDGSWRKIREVVDDVEVPKTWASQILADLVRVGLAVSKSGKEGGYRLTRSPKEISLLEIVEAGEGPLRAERCALGSGPCRWDDVCPLHDTWSMATEALRMVLDRSTLGELLERDQALEAGIYPVPEDSHRYLSRVKAARDGKNKVEVNLGPDKQQLKRVKQRVQPNFNG